jgi:hypothetical protein
MSFLQSRKNQEKKLIKNKGMMAELGKGQAHSEYFKQIHSTTIFAEVSRLIDPETLKLGQR